MARNYQFTEVVAVRLSSEGKAKLRRLSVELQLTECDVVRRLIRWAQAKPTPDIQFGPGRRTHDEEVAVVVGAD